MPKAPEYSLCEALNEADVANLLVRAMELMPDRYEDLLAIARNDQLSVEIKEVFLNGIVTREEENMMREMERERGRAYRREVSNSAVVWMGQASIGEVRAPSLFRSFGRRLPGN